MQACDQSITEANYHMYLSLIDEEHAELKEAVEAQDQLAQLDALVDILVVTIGAIRSMGADGEGAWNEVMRTNFAKIDPVTGKVRKREDGKVLKPEGWTPPDLKKFLMEEMDMDSDKMQRHIHHLEEKHQKLDTEIDSREKSGYVNEPGVSLSTLKKERLGLRDEIERCRHQLEIMLK